MFQCLLHALRAHTKKIEIAKIDAGPLSRKEKKSIKKSFRNVRSDVICRWTEVMKIRTLNAYFGVITLLNLISLCALSYRDLPC